MTKTLDISPQVLERTRQLTHTATDEEAIKLVIEAFAARGEDLARESQPARSIPTPMESLYTPEELAERRRRQAEFVKHLGTCDDFMTIEELREMRAMD